MSKWPAEDPELAKFKGPHVAVDIALLTVAEREDGSKALAALVHRRQSGLAQGEWALVGRMVRERESLADAAKVALSEKCGIKGQKVKQLFVSDEPTRDSRGWVMSVAHLATMPWEKLKPLIETDETLDLAFISDSGRRRYFLPEEQKELPFEHDLILDEATRVLKARYESRPDPDNFLPAEFTVLQLRETHEIVLGRKLDKDLFRRKMNRHLKSTGELSSGSVGKPAELFRRNIRTSRADASD
jgi:ADP-ribose pyrophosphatase YjhB (NUDIX family)